MFKHKCGEDNHKFEPRYITEYYKPCKDSPMMASPGAVCAFKSGKMYHVPYGQPMPVKIEPIRHIKSRTYVCDVCVKCGKYWEGK